MPELPEVETTARGLRPLVVGARVTGSRAIDWPRMIPNATPDQLDAAVRGAIVASVGRRGKYLLIGLSGDRWLVVHRKMSGNLLFRPPGATPARHTHLILDLEDAASGRPTGAVHFVDPRKFGRVYLFLTRAERDDFLAARLGPEPLGELSASAWQTLLSGRRGRIKSVLLDQRFLAGIGNLYADEILWEARIHPERSAARLTPREQSRLLAATRKVLTDAIERRGTSLSDYVDQSGEPGENQDYLRVYGRADQPCFRCGQAIVRLVVGQRGTWICRHCQRAPLAAPTSG